MLVRREDISAVSQLMDQKVYRQFRKKYEAGTDRRIWSLMHVLQAELRTLYIFADKLYNARKSVGFVKRLRIRYGV